MVEIREVRTKSELRKFVDFPNKMYKDVPQFIPANNIVSGLVYSSNGSEVDTVLVDGRVLMENRKLTTIDEQKVYEEIRKMAERLNMTP